MEEQDDQHSEADGGQAASQEDNRQLTTLASRYRLEDFVLPQKLAFKDTLFKDQVKGGWMDRTSFIDMVRKKGKYGADDPNAPVYSN